MATARGFQAASLALALLSGASIARAGHRGMNVSIDDGGDPRRCDQISVEIGGREALRAEERLVIPAAAGSSLRIRVPEHSGARVRGTDRADFEVLVCKAAPSADTLQAITVSHRDQTLTVDGPGEGDWVGYLLISAPKNAAIDLTAVNGPVELTELGGRVTVRSQNGPISIRNSAGDIDVEAENGPIHVRGGGGHVRLRTENGPIGVALSGASWEGAGLDARAVNGPLSLAIPAGYRSGTTVESLGRSPFQCRGEACAGARQTWDDEHKRLALGDGPAVVRLSTENGPVSVKTGKDLDEED